MIGILGIGSFAGSHIYDLFKGSQAVYETLPERNEDNKLSEEETASHSICMLSPERIPEYAGNDWIALHDGVPEFTLWDLDNKAGQYFDELDELGRCGETWAMLHRTMMPTEERGNIGSVKPTGWKQNKYEGVVDSNPPYLYNRCHLIAYGLTGENANERNLITGTRYFNVKVMLPWEEKVMRYLDQTDNHVLYRVTPLFVEKELLARGVELEAYSVEDEGRGICFHVFLYNIQPGVELDYSTGDNWLK